MTYSARSLDQKRAGLHLDRLHSISALPQLMALAPEARHEAVESDETFASPSVGALLLMRVEKLLETDPREAVPLASLAAAIGGRLGPAWTLLEGESLQGRARSFEGEALRRMGRLPEARKAHGRAFRHLEALPVECSERAVFCRHLGLLRRDEGRDDEAIALMARALERFVSYPDRRRAQQCRLDLAWLYLDEVESDMAMSFFEEALDEERHGEGWRDEWAGDAVRREVWVREENLEPWLSARHGLALAYADLRREPDARQILAAITEGLLGNPAVDPLRLKRVEAAVLQRLDANEEAAELLLAAWSGYALKGAPYEAALALLELAQLRAEQGSKQDLEWLKEGLAALAGLRENVREPLLLVLDSARSRGLAGVERLEALKLFVQRARHDPEARFVLDPEFAGLQGEEVDG